MKLSTVQSSKCFPAIPVFFFADELNHVADAEHELVLNERHPRIVVQFDHGARIEEVKLADLRGEDGEAIALHLAEETVCRKLKWDASNQCDRKKLF